MPNSLAIAAANVPGLPISIAGAVPPQSAVTDFSALLLSLTPPQFQLAGTPTAATEKPAKTISPAATIDVSMDPSLLLSLGGTIPPNLAGTPGATTTTTSSGPQAGPLLPSLEELALQQFDVRSIQIETELLPQSIQAVLPQPMAAQPVSSISTSPGALAGLQFSKFAAAVNATLTPDASQSDAAGKALATATLAAQPVPATTAPTVTKAGFNTKGTESKPQVLSDLVLATQSKDLAEAAPQEKSANMPGNQHAKFVPELNPISTATHTTETVFQALTAAGTGSTTPQDAALQSKGTVQTALEAPKGSDTGQPEVTDFVQAPDTPQYSPSAQNPQNTSATASAVAVDAKTVVLRRGQHQILAPGIRRKIPAIRRPRRHSHQTLKRRAR